MLVCNDKLEAYINDVDDVSRVNRTLEIVDEKNRIRAAVNRAKLTGKYATKKLTGSPDGWIGKVITVEDFDRYSFDTVTVKTASYIDEGVVSINGGEYIINETTNVTTNGAYGISLNSEPKGSVGTSELGELSGTVLQILDDIIGETKQGDTGVLSSKHEKHLDRVFDMYKDVLNKSGEDVELNVKFFEDLDEKNNTRGTATPELGKAELIMGNQRHNGVTEILAHELQHILIKNAFKKAPLLQNRVMELRSAMAKQLDYTVFLNGIGNPTKEDIDIAKERFDYAFNNDKFPADEFLAYATTNRQLGEALELINGENNNEWMPSVDLSVKDGKKPTKWKKLWARVVNLINKVYWSFTFKGGNARDIAMDLLDTALRIEHRDKASKEKDVYDKTLDSINGLDDRLAKFTGALKDEKRNYQEELRNKDKSFMDKAVGSLWRIKTLARVKSFALQNNLFVNMTRNMDNPDVSKMYEMFRHNKAFVDREVVGIKSATAHTLSETYGLGKVDPNKRRAAKRVLIDTDAGIIGSSIEIGEYLRDEDKLDSKVDELTKDMSEDMLIAIDDLAELLVTNVSKSKNGYANATQIVFGVLGDTDQELVSKVDLAVSLLALKKSDPINKALAVEAIDENAYGLDRALMLKAKDEAKVLEKAYDGNPMYAIKGAKQETFKKLNGQELKHYLVEKEQMEELVKAKMNNLGKHEELSRILGKDIYMIIGPSTDSGFSEGLISNVQLKNEGDSLRRLVMELGMYTENEAEELIETLSSEQGQATQALIPERSGDGLIYDYKLRIPHADKSKYLNLEDDIIHTVSGTVANLTHKQEAMLGNYAAINYITKFHDLYKNNSEYKFIEIGNKVEGKGKEYWDSLPYYVKGMVKKKMPKNNAQLLDGEEAEVSFFVEESMLVDTFGYKDASLTEVPWVRDKIKRQLVVKKFESIVKEVVAKWKQVIVTLTPATIKGNMFSNMIVALQHTDNKNPAVYMKKFQQFWGMMNDYQKDRKDMLELIVRKEAGEAIDQKRIDGLQAKMEANFVHVIMKDGQYTSILEDINTEFFDNEGILEGKLNAMLNKPSNEKTRETLKFIVDTLYVRKDSKLHGSIMKLTLFSDAINKLIMLEDMAKDGNVTQDMLNQVDRLHVNYSYLDNKYMKLANELFMTFTKYTFRVLPAMVAMAARKPATMFGFEGIQKGLGIDVETPIDQYFNPVDTLARKVSLWQQPVDVFKTIFVSPWIK